jgi:hypothetical protein
LHRVHAERIGDAVDVHLDGELGLGAPKPRNAPLGGVFVTTARPRIRVFSQRYGPAA